LAFLSVLLHTVSIYIWSWALFHLTFFLHVQSSSAFCVWCVCNGIALPLYCVHIIHNCELVLGTTYYCAIVISQCCKVYAYLCSTTLRILEFYILIIPVKSV
jgi:hypothetical protein